MNKYTAYAVILALGMLLFTGCSTANNPSGPVTGTPTPTPDSHYTVIIVTSSSVDAYYFSNDLGTFGPPTVVGTTTSSIAWEGDATSSSKDFQYTISPFPNSIVFSGYVLKDGVIKASFGPTTVPTTGYVFQGSI